MSHSSHGSKGNTCFEETVHASSDFSRDSKVRKVCGVPRAKTPDLLPCLLASSPDAFRIMTMSSAAGTWPLMDNFHLHVAEIMSPALVIPSLIWPRRRPSTAVRHELGKQNRATGPSLYRLVLFQNASKAHAGHKSLAASQLLSGQCRRDLMLNVCLVALKLKFTVPWRDRGGMSAPKKHTPKCKTCAFWTHHCVPCAAVFL